MAEEARLSVTDEQTVQFPDDILIEIFLKLPVRSLLLFKSVSKQWLRLIKSPNFIHLHINRPIHDDNHSYNPLLILRENLVLTLFSDDETLPFKDDVALEVLFPSLNFSGLKLLGPCNGLFCITDLIESVIFNPATKKCRKVTRSPLTLSPQSKPWYDCVAFGYDTVSYDYKLVMINEPLDANCDYPYRLDLRVGIYSLRSNSWRDINRVVMAERSETMYPYRDHNAFLNGAFHWLYNNKILVFDLHKEDFEWLDMPCICNEDWDFDPYMSDEDWDFGYNLSVLNESLALIRHWAQVEFKFEIWGMLEYGVSSSWTQLYDIKADVGIERALSLSNKGEFILEIKDGELASLDVETMAIKLFNVETRTTLVFNSQTRTEFVCNSETRQVERVPQVVNAYRYRESLVSLM